MQNQYSRAIANMQVIYATIIDPKRYKDHGRAMIQSFREKQGDELLVGVNQRMLFNEKNTFFFDMTEYPAYRSWNRVYKRALEGGIKDKEKVFDLKCSKSTALISIISKTPRKNLDYVVWVDCESIFNNRIDSKIIEEICGDYDSVSVLNSNGPMSFIIYNFRTGGKQFARTHAEFYTSEEFKGQKYWDTIFTFNQVNGYHTKSVTKSPIDNLLSYSPTALS